MISEVKIFDLNSFTTLFDSASPIQINVREEQKATQFPVENGETRSDHVIQQPTEITLDILLTRDMKNSYHAILQAFNNQQLLGIKTKVTTFESMLLVSVHHDEVADMHDAIKLSLRFSQWKRVEPQYSELSIDSVIKPEQASTVNRGHIQTQDADDSLRQKSAALIEAVDSATEDEQ